MAAVLCVMTCRYLGAGFIRCRSKVDEAKSREPARLDARRANELDLNARRGTAHLSRAAGASTRAEGRHMPSVVRSSPKRRTAHAAAARLLGRAREAPPQQPARDAPPPVPRGRAQREDVQHPRAAFGVEVLRGLEERVAARVRGRELRRHQAHDLLGVPVLRDQRVERLGRADHALPHRGVVEARRVAHGEPLLVQPPDLVQVLDAEAPIRELRELCSFAQREARGGVAQRELLVEGLDVHLFLVVV
mmetsp:Transcript_13029/g.38808  ORF Transcript_13029/g.38808 Transcript_13029/m.38808 type:complete len:248 (-) Transcript_13029:149-892(-)